MQDYLLPLDRTLREHGYSVTNVRTSIFTTLHEHGPLTVAEIYKLCGAGIDRASVYRTVKLFEQLGIINRVHIGWKYKLELSDQFQHHHHHLTCQRCGSVTTLHEDSEIEEQLEVIAARYDFDMNGHLLEITGLCANCRGSKQALL
jgi:Fur family ferric uptake transcriptional regulator